MYNKYLKYKRKYLTLKNITGGDGEGIEFNQCVNALVNEFDGIIKNNREKKMLKNDVIKKLKNDLIFTLPEALTEELQNKIKMAKAEFDLCSINEHFYNFIDIVIKNIEIINVIRVNTIKQIHLDDLYFRSLSDTTTPHRIDAATYAEQQNNIFKQIKIYKERMEELKVKCNNELYTIFYDENEKLIKTLNDAIILENDLSPDEYNSYYSNMSNKVKNISNNMNSFDLTQVQTNEFKLNRSVFHTIIKLMNIIDYVDYIRDGHQMMFCILSNPITNTMSRNAVEELGEDYKIIMRDRFLAHNEICKFNIKNLMDELNFELNFERIFDFDNF